MTKQLTTPDEGTLVLAEQWPLDQNPAAVYLAGLGKGSQRTMRSALNTIAIMVSGGQADALTLAWSRLRFQHTAAIRAKLAEVYAPATANKMLSAVRGVLRAAWRLGQLDAETYQRAVDLEVVKGERLPTGRNLTTGEISAMFAACANDQTSAGIRDAAILALLRLGLRRQEIASLELADYNPAEKTLTVRGKRNKERLVLLMNAATAALADWLTVRGDDPGPLLRAVNKGGRILRKGISPQAVYNVLRKRARLAGVCDLTPHDWRRTFAGDLLDAGADLSVVQKLMGHASPTTTARYDRRPEAAKRRAVERLHIPWER
jgi:site-specific recombinase XerD